MILIPGYALGQNANLNTFALHVTPNPMANQGAQISITVILSLLCLVAIDFFGVRDIQTGVPDHLEGLDTIGNRLTNYESDKGIYTLANTPICLENLEKSLASYPSEDANFILNGFKKGFPLQYHGPR